MFLPLTDARLRPSPRLDTRIAWRMADARTRFEMDESARRITALRDTKGDIDVPAIYRYGPRDHRKVLGR